MNFVFAENTLERFSDFHFFVQSVDECRRRRPVVAQRASATFFRRIPHIKICAKSVPTSRPRDSVQSCHYITSANK